MSILLVTLRMAPLVTLRSNRVTRPISDKIAKEKAAISIMIILGQIFKENGDYMAFMFLLIPVYFTAGMKRFYQQALWKIILKEVILGGIYTIILLVTLLVAGYITLYFI